MTNIAAIIGREVLDSRGNPTVEAEVILEAARLAGRLFPAEPRPESTKLSNCATAIRRAFLARAF